MNESLAGHNGLPPEECPEDIPNSTGFSAAAEDLIPGRPPVDEDERNRILFLARFVVALTVFSAVVLGFFATVGGKPYVLGFSVIMVVGAIVYYLQTKKKLARDMAENPL